MVRRIVLLTSLTLVFAVAGVASPASARACTNVDALTGACGEVSGGGVDVGVESTQGGGSDGGGGDGGDGEAGDEGGSAEGGAPVPCASTNVALCSEMRRITPDTVTPRTTTPRTTTPVVTTREVAHLVPGVGAQGMEPKGWMVVGLPTNFYADASSSIVSTTLLGSPADVRFTPVSFNWDHGDGSTTTGATGGATWAALGLAEFSETATSHVYDSPGSYTISLTVLYSAEYRIGGGEWRTLAGTVPSTSPPMTASAKLAKTVLVADDCGRRRASPGC